MSWSTKWKGSKSPRKQRNYAANAPLHISRKFMSAQLSPELRKKHNTRSAQLRVGDQVTVQTGQFKKRTGKVEVVDVKNKKVFIGGVEIVKKDGSKTQYPVHPSNVMITQFDTSDKRRLKNNKKASKSKEKKE